MIYIETTATTLASEASTDIEARIKMLKEQLKRRREEVKKSQQEQKKKKRALLKQKEAELKQKLEVIIAYYDHHLLMIAC